MDRIIKKNKNKTPFKIAYVYLKPIYEEVIKLLSNYFIKKVEYHKNMKYI